MQASLYAFFSNFYVEKLNFFPTQHILLLFGSRAADADRNIIIYALMEPVFRTEHWTAQKISLLSSSDFPDIELCNWTSMITQAVSALVISEKKLVRKIVNNRPRKLVREKENAIVRPITLDLKFAVCVFIAICISSDIVVRLSLMSSDSAEYNFLFVCLSVHFTLLNFFLCALDDRQSWLLSLRW